MIVMSEFNVYDHVDEEELDQILNTEPQTKMFEVELEQSFVIVKYPTTVYPNVKPAQKKYVVVSERDMGLPVKALAEYAGHLIDCHYSYDTFKNE